MHPIYPKWTQGDGNSVAQLTAITGSPGNLWPYPVTALPAGIANHMPEIRDCFISGYLNPETVAGGVKAIGELLVTRAHEVPESGKAYVYLVAVDYNAQPHFLGPFKPYDGHYYREDAGVPVEKLFGKIDLGDLGKRIV